MQTLDQGAGAVWPKLLTCRNCGNEVLVESFDDMVQSLPHFAWLKACGPHAFQFLCPNACGNGFAAITTTALQALHHAPHVMYGGSDMTEMRSGRRRVDPLRRQLRRTPKRRRGGSDGPIPVAR